MHVVFYEVFIYFGFQNWEMLVLSKLKWNVTAITGFDYVDHVLERVDWSKENPLIRRHAHTLVGLCYTGE